MEHCGRLFVGINDVGVFFKLYRLVYYLFTVQGEHPHRFHPAAMKLAFRYHIQRMCKSPHCVDSLVLYLNSPAKNDGTFLLWDVNVDGLVSSLFFVVFFLLRNLSKANYIIHDLYAHTFIFHSLFSLELRNPRVKRTVFILVGAPVA